jgi:hypothetical protein
MTNGLDVVQYYEKRAGLYRINSQDITKYVHLLIRYLLSVITGNAVI